MADEMIKIYYAPEETGPAQLLGGRLARIVDPAVFGNLWQDDIVLLTHDPEEDEGFPAIEEVVWSRYPVRSNFTFKTDEETQGAVEAILPPLLRFLKADCFIPSPGRLCVAHHGVDVALLAEAIGLTLVEDEA